MARWKGSGGRNHTNFFFKNGELRRLRNATDDDDNDCDYDNDDDGNDDDNDDNDCFCVVFARRFRQV